MSKTAIKIPSADIMIEGLRSMGYSFQTAVADIIDNSIAAHATEVRIFYDPKKESAYFAVCDNGTGMSEEEFNRALDFGTKKERPFSDKKDLGRFGLGLKTASLSQCKRLSVLTKKGGSFFGAYWDIDDIVTTNAWQVTFLSMEEIKQSPCFSYLESQISGTVVIWQKFDRIERTTDDFSGTMQRIVQSDVLNHCALVFHRFYSTMPIFINNVQIPKRDPFLDDSQKCIVRPEIQIETGTPYPIRVRAYRMPAEGDLNREERDLIGGKQSILTDDGLYIYRNDRLIAWGSWMKLERRNLYSHLARIKIDIPSSIDAEWGLDVKKSTAVIPDFLKQKIRPAILDAIKQSMNRTRYVGRAESNAGIERVWQRTVLEDHKVKYELNRDYPILQQLKETLSPKQKVLLHSYLEDVVSFVPVGKMRDDVHDSLLAINGKDDQQKDDNLIEELFAILDTCNFGSAEDGVEMLSTMLRIEKFSSLRDRESEIIKKYRGHYGAK